MKVVKYRNENDTVDKITISDMNVAGAKVLLDALQFYMNHISHYGGKNINFFSLLFKQIKEAIK